jgi:hypothetical protein
MTANVFMQKEAPKYPTGIWIAAVSYIGELEESWTDFVVFIGLPTPYRTPRWRFDGLPQVCESPG